MAIRAVDQQTLVDLTDGYSVYLEKYAHIFNGSTTSAIAGSTTCKVTAMIGPDIVPCSVNLGDIVSPTGVTVTKDAHVTTPTLTITASTAFAAPGFVTIPVVVDGGVTIVQSMAVSFAKTGATGTSSTIAGLMNEAQTIPCSAAGLTPSASTINVGFYGYVGSTRTACTATVGTLPSGITVGTNTAGTGSVDGVLSLSVASGSSLGGAVSGQIPITITCNSIPRTIQFSWSKALAGADGLDSIRLEMSSSAGVIFKNTSVATTLTARVYKGAAEISGATLAAIGVVKWYKDGTYLTGKDGATLVVASGDVVDRAIYEARLEG